MSTVSTAIETRYTANIIDFEKQVARMASLNERAAKRIEQQALKSSTAMKSAWEKNNFSSAIKAQASELDGLTASFARLAPAIAAAITVQGALSLVDSYNNLTNALKVAGIEGKNLADVQKQLGQIADKTGAPINALATLLGRATRASKDLGLSQQQTIALTTSVATGLQASGTNATEASGALLQLSQALGSGTVHAQEFNSVNEGIPALLQAAAAASTKYGGSVAKMKKDVNDGKLSSKEFAALLIAAQETLSSQTGKMTTTQSQAITKLQNAMILYMGQVDESLGISEKFAAVLGIISQNLDILVLAVAAGATVIGGRMVAAMVAYTLSTIAGTAGTFRFAAAMKGIPLSAAAAEASLIGLKAAGSAVLGIFGGPLGLAITGVTLAVGYLVSENQKADQATKDFNATIAEYAKHQKDAADAAAIAKAVQSGNAQAIPDHIKKIAALTNQVSDLAKEWGVVAAQAKEARLQQLQAMLTDNVKVYREAEKRHKDAVRNDEIATNMTRVGWGEDAVLGNPNAKPIVSQAQLDAQKALATAKAENDNINTQIYKATNERLTPLPTDKPKPPKGSGSKTDESPQALREAAQIQLAVALANAKTEEERHKVRLSGLAIERDAEIAEIEAKKNISAKAKETRVQAENAKYLTGVSEENKKYAAYQKAQEQAINYAVNDQLGLKLALVTTAKEQHEIALQQFEYAHQQNIAAIDENEAYDAATKAKLKQVEQENYTLEIERESHDLAQKQLDERKAQIDVLANLAQFQQDALEQEAALAKTRKERAALERQALLSRQQFELEKARLDQEQLVQDKKISQQQADEALANIQKRQNGERQAQAKANGSPLDQYYEEIGNFDDAYSNIVVGGLKTIDDSISGLVDKTKSWGDVFHDVALGVVTDIAKILLRQALIKPIAKLLGAGDSSGSASDFVVKAADMQTYSANSTKGNSGSSLITDATQLAKMFGIPGFKSGVENFGGGLAYVHAGEMLTNLPAGTSVKTAAQTRNLLNPFKNSGSIQAAAPTVNQNFYNTINADGVKTTEMFKGWIAQASQQAAQQARDAAINGVQKKDRNTIR